MRPYGKSWLMERKGFFNNPCREPELILELRPVMNKSGVRLQTRGRTSRKGPIFPPGGWLGDLTLPRDDADRFPAEREPPLRRGRARVTDFTMGGGS